MTSDQGKMHDDGIAEARERVAITRQAEGEERERQAYTSFTADEVRGIVGDGTYFIGRRVLDQHLETLPGSQREQLEDEMRHSPARAMQVVGELIGPLPTTLAAVNAEIEVNRKRMRTDPKGWFADDKAQLRYQTLLRTAVKE